MPTQQAALQETGFGFRPDVAFRDALYKETGGWGMSPPTCRQIVTCRAWTSKPSLIFSRRRSPAPSPTHLIFVVFMIGSLHRRVMSSLGASKVPDWEIASRRKV
jgi:hypothetical protein